MQIWVLLITMLVPLAIAPGLVSAFDITPKIAILLVCESALLLFCKQLVNGLRPLWESTLGRCFIACLGFEWLSSAASTLASSNPRLSAVGSSWRRDGLLAESAILLFALLIAGWFLDDPRRIRAVLRTAVLTGAAASLYGIAQYFGWDPFLPAKAYQAGEDWFTIVRPPATFGHADYFANWLVMVVFFAVALARLEWKIIARSTAGLATFAIILSGTRSAMLGLVIGAIVFLAIARPRIDRTAILILAAAVACLGLLYVSPPGAKLRARVHWSLDDLRGGARLLLWRDSLHMAMTRPLSGYGPETFPTEFPRFESVQLSRAYPDFYQESPHNMFLDALVSRGIPGAIALVALCALALYAARKDAALAAAAAGAIVCQQFMVLTIPTALYFDLLIAMIVGGARVPVGRVDVRLRALTAAISLLFLVIATRLIVADRAMAGAENKAALGDVQGAAADYRIVQRWQPSAGAHDDAARDHHKQFPRQRSRRAAGCRLRRPRYRDR